MLTRGLLYAVVVTLCMGAGWAWAGNESGVNTWYGQGAGAGLTTGTNNTFIGFNAGNHVTVEQANTFVGNNAGVNTTESFNTFVGALSGYTNTSGANNTFLGYGAGNLNTEGDNNSFLGNLAGCTNTTGHDNTFLGNAAGYANTTGTANTIVGDYAGYHNTTGSTNNFIGGWAGHFNTAGINNSFIGYRTGYNNTTGDANTFLGNAAGYANTTGSSNTCIGTNAGFVNTVGNQNTFLGFQAGYSNATGSGNLFLGYNAGYSEVGSNKLYVDNSDTSSPLIYGEFDNHKLTVNGNLQVIGPDNGLVRLSDNITNNTTKVSRMVLNHYSNGQLPVYLFGAASTATGNFVAFGGGATIGNAATQIDLFTALNATTSVGTSRLTIKGNGNVGIGTQTPTQPLHMASGAYVTAGGVWTNASSREHKDNIRSLRAEDAMEALKGLNPVTFNYRASANEGHVGFIAEEVPELVSTKDRKGLSPMDIVAVLTKVVQEQQRVMQEQQKTISNLREELNELKGKVR